VRPETHKRHSLRVLTTAVSRREAHLRRKGRSEGTIEGYRGPVEKILRAWLRVPLAELGADPRLVADRHDVLTRTRGPIPDERRKLAKTTKSNLA